MYNVYKFEKNYGGSLTEQETYNRDNSKLKELIDVRGIYLPNCSIHLVGRALVRKIIAPSKKIAVNVLAGSTQEIGVNTEEARLISDLEEILRVPYKKEQYEPSSHLTLTKF